MSKTGKILFILLIIGFVFTIYKYGYAHKNNIEKYITVYDGKIKPVKVHIPLSAEYGYTFKGARYKRGVSLIGFKALSGKIYKYNFFEDSLKKYFSINLFDTKAERTAGLDAVLRDKDILASINQDDLKNPSYGTRENPIPIFRFKGVLNPIEITSWNADGSEGMESLEPTQEEYDYNVNTYLTYIMTGKEFDERVKRETKF